MCPGGTENQTTAVNGHLLSWRCLISASSQAAPPSIWVPEVQILVTTLTVWDGFCDLRSGRVSFWRCVHEQVCCEHADEQGALRDPSLCAVCMSQDQCFPLTHHHHCPRLYSQTHKDWTFAQTVQSVLPLCININAEIKMLNNSNDVFALMSPLSFFLHTLQFCFISTSLSSLMSLCLAALPFVCNLVLVNQVVYKSCLSATESSLFCLLTSWCWVVHGTGTSNSKILPYPKYN